MPLQCNSLLDRKDKKLNTYVCTSEIKSQNAASGKADQ